jgi:hypothetical protein
MAGLPACLGLGGFHPIGTMLGGSDRDWLALGVARNRARRG